MSKLYPPYIESSVPAFYIDNSQVLLTVPFTMNRAVGINDIANNNFGMVLKIKTANGNTVLNSDPIYSLIINTDYNSVIFDITNTVFKTDSTELNKNFYLGNFYKIQIAYVDNNYEIGYYSSTAVTKFTSKPNVFIANLDIDGLNNHSYEYVLNYSNTEDITEKLYSSEFILTDSNNSIVYDSGEIIHSVMLDIDSDYQRETCYIENDLDENEIYHLKVIVKSLNSLEISTKKYKIIQRKNVESELEVNFIATLDSENGIVKLNIVSSNKDPIVGNFLIGRKSNKENGKWETIKYFSLNNEFPKLYDIEDNSVEQGLTYTYCIQQYNDNNYYSERILSNEIYVDFEDMFLSDMNRQLRIRFNPTVSTYNLNVEENMSNTIGNKYPFFTRNANVKYKNFSINGLLSYLMDNDERFLTNEEMLLKDSNFSRGTNEYIDGNYRTTQLVDYNVAAERIFKNEVLDWISDGKPKLLRTPTEGNYIVRLMSYSLSPNDATGRILHSFTTNAYEIGEFNYDNLVNYSLVSLEKTKYKYMQFNSFNFQKEIINNPKSSWAISASGTLPTIDNAQYIQFDDFIPGTIITIINSNDSSVLNNIIVGPSGNYKVNFDEPESISCTIISPEKLIKGLVSWGYWDNSKTLFNSIDNVENKEILGKQFKTSDVITCKNETSENILEDYNLSNIKNSINKILILKFIRKPVQKIYLYENEYYYEWNHINKVNLADGIIYRVYEALNKNEELDQNYLENNFYMYYNEKNDSDEKNSKEIFKGYYCYKGTRIKNDNDNYDYKIKFQIISENESYPLFEYRLNDNIYNLDIEETITYYNIDTNYITFNEGIECELSCQVRIINYDFENSSNLITYNDYTKSKENLLNLEDSSKIESYILSYLENYIEYLEEIENYISNSTSDSLGG